jgi:hypothetical protein
LRLATTLRCEGKGRRLELEGHRHIQFQIVVLYCNLKMVCLNSQYFHWVLSRMYHVHFLRSNRQGKNLLHQALSVLCKNDYINLNFILIVK